MASFQPSSSDSVENAIQSLKKANLFDDDIVSSMLTVGSEMMVQSVKSAFVDSGHNNITRPRRTGETFRHISKSKSVKKDKNGVPYMEVTVTGKDRRNQRYGTKAFVLNYGRRKGGKIPADYYWSDAVKNTRERVSSAMAEVARQKIGGSE